MKLNSMEHFQHLERHVRRTTPRGKPLRPSPCLDVAMTREQGRLLDPSPEDYFAGAIMRDAGGNGANVRMAKRKLNTLGNFRYYSHVLCHIACFVSINTCFCVICRSHCGIQNDPERIGRMRDELMVAQSVAEITALQQKEAEAAKLQEEAQSKEAAPAAFQKLMINEFNLEKLKKDELSSIAVSYFNQSKLKGSKPDFVKRVKALMDASPMIVDAIKCQIESNGGAGGPDMGRRRDSRGSSVVDTARVDSESVAPSVLPSQLVASQIAEVPVRPSLLLSSQFTQFSCPVNNSCSLSTPVFHAHDSDISRPQRAQFQYSGGPLGMNDDISDKDPGSLDLNRIFN